MPIFDLVRLPKTYKTQQFDLGYRLYSDILETERSLRKYEQNYIQAFYDHLAANISYQKAIGNFDVNGISVDNN